MLAQKNMDKQAYPASTTKILTAIIAIEKLNLNDIITASNSAVMAIPVGYSNAGIKAGEKFDVKNLLQMFLIHSANEVGYIFAEKIETKLNEDEIIELYGFLDELSDEEEKKNEGANLL